MDARFMLARGHRRGRDTRSTRSLESALPSFCHRIRSQPSSALMDSGRALVLSDWAFLKQWKGPSGCVLASLSRQVRGTCATTRAGLSLLVF